MAAKVQIMNHEALLGIYTPEVREALGAYGAHLAEEKGALEDRERELEEKLEQYEDVKGLAAAGGRVGLVKEEIERVKGDIDKLEAGGRG